MKKLIACLGALVLALTLSCRRRGGPTDPGPIPTSPPVTSPTPPPQKPFPSRIVGNRFDPPLLGFHTCCASPGLDEGVRDGWETTGITDERARDVSQYGVNIVGLRTGPHDLTDYDATGRTILMLRGLRMMAEVDLVDGWRLVHRNNIYGDGCDIVNRPLPERYKVHIRAVVAAAQPSIDSVIFHVGNEIGRCHPPDRWYQEVAAEAKAADPRAIVGGDEDVSGLDYFTYHGFRFNAPMNVPVINNESDNEVHSADEWESLIKQGYDTNGQVNILYWPGPENDAQRNEVLRRIKKISEGQGETGSCQAPSSCPPHTRPGLKVHTCEGDTCTLDYTPKFNGHPCNDEHNRVCGCTGQDESPLSPTWRRCEDPRGPVWTNARPLSNKYLAKARVGDLVRVCPQSDPKDSLGKEVEISDPNGACREITVIFLSPGTELQ